MPKGSQECYVVRWLLGFDYVQADKQTPVRVDHGQIITLVGARNDQSLVRLGYLSRLVGETRVAECGECGEKFMDDQTRDAHGRKTHKRRAWEEAEAIGQAGHGYVDTLGDGEETRAVATTPLYMDKTKAAQKA